MADIYVRLEEVNSELRICWSQGGGAFDPYNLDKPGIIQRSTEARKALQDVVNTIMQDSKNKQNINDSVKNLAEKGYSLYKWLFKGQGQKDEPFAREVRTWFEEELPNERHDIWFDVQNFHIPWNLVYEKNPQEHVGEAFEDFWCVKYSPCTLYNVPPLGLYEPRTADSHTLLSAVQESIWNASEQALDKGAEKRVFARFFKERKPIKTKKELFAEWGGSPEKVGILYFYCHSNQFALDLGNEEVLTMHEFSEHFEREKASKGSPPTLVFLAGCNTAVGDPDGGFLKAIGNRGFCGFVGTEAAVPDLFALKFSLALLSELFDRALPLGDALHILRKRHWPLSLIYSLCGHPKFRISSVPTKPRGLIFPEENLSYGKLVSKEKMQ